jgi:hypothetical protein
VFVNALLVKCWEGEGRGGGNVEITKWKHDSGVCKQPHYKRRFLCEVSISATVLRDT